MRGVARLILYLALPAILAGCGNVVPADNAADADPNALADASMDGNAADARAPSPGANAVAGDVIEGQEVLFYGGGLAVGVIQTHPGQRYDFGRPQAEILAMLANVHSQQLGSGTIDCAGGRLDFADFRNLRVFFRDGRFVGWDVSPGHPQIRDEWSFSIGSPRDDITDMGDDDLRIFNSPRGVEFEADDVHGLLSADRPDGVVIDLWSGSVCPPQ